ncbi:hypothetical protein [Bacillus piscicola]|uniref:hypothetical protein n=1 Tax=Bacillus piscicola TaxID=1632684 RepID=UPI001F097D12|nr:hypothetical protein [Bacillus piscicola]
MKHRDFENDKVEKMLGQMPLIKDERTKEEIFRNIDGIAVEKTRRRQKRAYPAFLGAAAILLLLVFLPPLMSGTNESAGDVPKSAEVRGDARIQREEHSEDAAKTVPDQKEREAGEDNQKATDCNQKEEGLVTGGSQKETTEKAREESRAVSSNSLPASVYAPAVSTADVADDQKPVTIPLLAKDSSIIVPVTFLVSGQEDLFETYSSLIEEYSGKEAGLETSPLQDIHLEEVGNAETPATNVKELSSEENGDLIIRSLEESIPFINEKNVSVRYDGETGALGDYGLLDHYEIKRENRGYYVYTSPAGISFLVSSNAAALPVRDESGALYSFSKTLKQMTAVRSEEVEPPIPETVHVERAERNGSEAQVVFSNDSRLPESWNGNIMVEAILLAAADFGIEQVEFSGGKIEKIDGYEAGKSISVPLAPNKMPPVRMAGGGREYR